MVTGTVNADGFGVGWYVDSTELPGTYHRATPIWSDPDLPRFGRVVESRSIFAALRNATPGFPVDLPSSPPFVHGRYLFMHNGALQGFARRFRSALLEGIPESIRATLYGPSDAEMMFAMARSRLVEKEDTDAEGAAGVLREALEWVNERVLRVALEKQVQASINMGITDGQAMVLCRLARGIPANSLYVRSDEEAVWVVSEPLDETGTWQQVPEDTWVIVSAAGEVELLPMAGLPPEEEWS
jgi:glutamine amidotransferase